MNNELNEFMKFEEAYESKSQNIIKKTQEKKSVFSLTT
jgi:hypothetical protein